MIAPFSFSKLPEIHFGLGTFSKLPDKIKRFGDNALLVLGNRSFQNSNHWNKLQNLLKEKNICFLIVNVNNEPTSEFIDDTISLYRNNNIDVIVSIGGGSVLDAGKAISAMFFKEKTIVNYLEGVGNKIHDGKKLPFIAVPTTSGTGSEVTKNAVLCERGPNGYKKSLRHDNFIPDVAIIDPGLTIGCPQSITGASGLDTFSQLIESYTSTKASVITDSLAIKAIKCVKRSLLKAYNDGSNVDARSDMAYASAISGITLANAGLGLIHGFASSIGGYFDIPHGIVCGTFIGTVNRMNIKKLIEQNSDNWFLNKYAEIGKLFTAHNSKSKEYYALLLADELDKMVEGLNLPKISEFGVSETDIERIILLSGHKNNPVKFKNEELKEILTERI